MMGALVKHDLNDLRTLLLELSKESLQILNEDNDDLSSFILKITFAAGTRVSIGQIQLVDGWQDTQERSEISYCSFKAFFSSSFLANIQPVYANIHLVNWLIVLPNINTLPKKIKPTNVNNYLNMISIELMENEVDNDLIATLDLLSNLKQIKPTSQHSA